MKALLPKLWAKASALILFILAVLILIPSAAGVVYLIYNGAYSDGGSRAMKNIVSGDMFASRMSDALRYYSTIENQSDWDANEFKDRFSEENSNFFFTIKDESGKVLLENYRDSGYQYSRNDTHDIIINEEPHSDLLSFKNYQDRWSFIEECQNKYYNVDYSAWDDDTDGDGVYECVVEINYTTGDMQTISITGYVKDKLTAPDEFAAASYWTEKLINIRILLIAITILSFVCSLFLFVFLICSAGHKEGVEGIHLNWIDRIPFDLYLLFILLACVFGAIILDEFSFSLMKAAAVLAVMSPLALLLLMSLVMTFAARAKAGQWWKNTLIFRIIKLIGRFFSWFFGGAKNIARALPLIWKLALLWTALSIVEFICLLLFRFSDDILILLWLIEKVLLTGLLFTAASNMKTLQEGGREIAAGNLSHSIDLNHMFWDFKKHGENLNSIGGGMQKAVDERMKSEHLKTELITNVSHDIKTPITSIVNYVDLLKKEELGSEKAAEYVSVLDRQSMRLKKLTEDLVEASKASTGNIPVNIECVNCSLLLSQAIGEYEDRLSAHNLEVIQDTSDVPTEIWADGKLLWRVFDNLLSNVCKYALEGTRVYVSAEPREDQLIITFKNISNYPLNISSDELMERFVRGDSSRSTEGSGLGLSIAKSLTELQNGLFELIIDGDLFKAQLSFARCIKPGSNEDN